MRPLTTALLISALAASPAAAHNPWGAHPGSIQVPPGERASSAPDRIDLTWLTWGQVREAWVIPDGGLARWSEDDQERAFTVTAADFSLVREVLRPYEGREFRCERIVPDMPYGQIVWSWTGGGDHEVGFDAGCTGGDADDLLRRLEEVQSVLEALRDRT
ncbi:MAG: hypothetical protein EON90_06220 [Brevundimonas sp.]|nr:MAG: hypothetical protein EON90_06220 [Brevundimonas sp.]